MICELKSFIKLMKKITIVGITQKSTFIVEDQTEAFRQVITFEGFQLNTNINKRHELIKLIGIQIEGTINKSSKALRYHNEQFFKDLIKKNMITVNTKQLDESKIFTPQQKQEIKKAKPQNNIEKQVKVVNYTADYPGLFKNYYKKMIIAVKLEYLSSNNELVVRYDKSQQQIQYIPIQFSNIDHQFELVSFETQGKFFKENYLNTLNIQLLGCFYSLDKKIYKLMAKMDNQIQLRMMKEGWGTISKNNVLTPQQLDERRLAQIQAKKNSKGIFKKNFNLLSRIYTQNNLVGVVSDIINGYTFEIRSLANDHLLKIQLIYIFSPIDNEVGAYDSKEFARKNLIGKQVNIFLKNNNELNMLGSITRISDGKDVELLMLENGWAYLKDQNKGLSVMAKYEYLEQKAKEKQKGLFRKEMGLSMFQDLTAPNLKKEQLYYETRYNLLKKFGKFEEGVIDGMGDGINYKIRFETKRVIIKLKLQQIRGISINPLLPQYKQIKQKLRDYLNRNMLKRTVLVSLSDYQSNSNTFVGTIYLPEQDKKSFQELLLQQSLVYCATNSLVSENYRKIEEVKRLQGNGVWIQKLVPLRPKDKIDEMPAQFFAKFSYVQNGETLYVQPSHFNQKIEQINKIINNAKLQPLKKQNAILGVICLAPYYDEFYRARIISCKNKKYKVMFIDWGNKEVVELGVLKELPAELNYVEPQSFKVKMNIVKPLRGNLDCLERVREQLLEGEYKLVKFFGNLVNVYKNGKQISLQFIHKGLMRMDPNKITDKEVMKHLLTVQQQLRINRVGVWQFSDEEEITSEEEQEYQNRIL